MYSNSTVGQMLLYFSSRFNVAFFVCKCHRSQPTFLEYFTMQIYYFSILHSSRNIGRFCVTGELFIQVLFNELTIEISAFVPNSKIKMSDSSVIVNVQRDMDIIASNVRKSFVWVRVIDWAHNFNASERITVKYNYLLLMVLDFS